MRSRVIEAAAILGILFPLHGNAQDMDAVSREVSVFNDLLNPPVIADAVSREVSIFNSVTPPTVITDAVSREVSVTNAFGCPTSLHGRLSGNLTDDGLVTTADIAPFVNVLIGAMNDPQLRSAADMNCDTHADGQDIQLFVTVLLDP